MTVANLTTTVEEITDREIGLWKMRTVPLPKIDDALYEEVWGKEVKKNLFPNADLNLLSLGSGCPLQAGTGHGRPGLAPVRC